MFSKKLAVALLPLSVLGATGYHYSVEQNTGTVGPVALVEAKKEQLDSFIVKAKN